MSKPNLSKKDLKNVKNFNTAFYKIFDALAEFRGHYDKKFNVSKLFEYLELSKADSNQVIDLIFKIQDVFKTVLYEYDLERKTINNVNYLIAKKTTNNLANWIKKDVEVQKIPKEIEINKIDVDIINDMVYMFKFVKRGKGFNLDSGNTKLLEKLKKLYLEYPYFFQKNGNDSYYPSQLSQKLGDLIFTYKKNNKKMEEFQVEDCKIKIKNDGS